MPINYWAFALGSILRLLGFGIDDIGQIIWTIASILRGAL